MQLRSLFQATWKHECTREDHALQVDVTQVRHNLNTQIGHLNQKLDHIVRLMKEHMRGGESSLNDTQGKGKYIPNSSLTYVNDDGAIDSTIRPPGQHAQVHTSTRTVWRYSYIWISYLPERSATETVSICG